MGAGGNLLVAQSGGATAVINASLAGVVRAALEHRQFGAIIGARHGIDGVLTERFVDLGRQPAEILDQLLTTPSAALGTTRRRLTDETAARAVRILAQYDIRAVAYIGGNDSADTALRLAAAARDAGYDLRVVSVPKTIDNDLPGTDHCPGYGSIARFLALAARDAVRDTEATAALYPVKFIEVMGRNAGWVAAATALGQDGDGDGPHLIFFPERPPRDLHGLLEEVQRAYDRHGQVVAVVPETLKDAQGRPLSGEDLSWTDPFGHRYYPSPGPALTRAVEEHLGLRARFDKPGTIARMFAACVSSVDRREAYEVGAAAVRLLVEGASEVMVTLERVSDDPYAATTGVIAAAEVANRERRMPDAFIGPDGRSVTDAFRTYALPLIDGPLPPYARLLDLPYLRA
ncbi:MAG: diphosphate--fructose-6-phosphate 1-phosphotransferase [Sphaerobacter thermophilus]|uniref:diphosphate--fructose-6-phosphate 1-phosphotransferase n=1 Tax=Sphaerobacter thermophilus TaxID=2057 RepID=UPI000DB1E429|nr:MAG: phosphofructokinase [Sphaerobacter thermophilus]